ncbi:hypothetical protein C8F04DRAFT_1275267 [Mycena alexandri]|uniref:Uncharacterized protein n=1 Tax=Mycena alexandri TaxID=1745969 RepID=A0AAD6S307_9AGAR|nr:hypothetical protein C8F04DRAFT_1275267 [Mycena alexandri]
MSTRAHLRLTAHPATFLALPPLTYPAAAEALHWMMPNLEVFWLPLHRYATESVVGQRAMQQTETMKMTMQLVMEETMANVMEETAQEVVELQVEVMTNVVQSLFALWYSSANETPVRICII